MRLKKKVLRTLEEASSDKEVRLGQLTSMINRAYPRRMLNPFESDDVRQVLKKLVASEIVVETDIERFRLARNGEQSLEPLGEQDAKTALVNTDEAGL